MKRASRICVLAAIASLPCVSLADQAGRQLDQREMIELSAAAQMAPDLAAKVGGSCGSYVNSRGKNDYGCKPVMNMALLGGAFGGLIGGAAGGPAGAVAGAAGGALAMGFMASAESPHDGDAPSH